MESALKVIWPFEEELDQVVASRGFNEKQGFEWGAQYRGLITGISRSCARLNLGSRVFLFSNKAALGEKMLGRNDAT